MKEVEAAFSDLGSAPYGFCRRIERAETAGFSQVPCPVQDVPGLGRIARYGSSLFQEHVLMAPRPPLFTDFADPEPASMAPLRATHEVTRIRPDEYLIVS